MLLNSSNLNPSLCVTSSGVERLTCFCCQSSTRTPVRRTPWQLHDSTSDVFYVSSESYFDCSSMLQLASFLFLGHDGLFTKNHARFIIFRPSSDQQNPQEKNDCFHQISNWDHRKPRRPSELCLLSFMGGPIHACCIRKNIRTCTLYCTTLLNHCITVLKNTIAL